MTSKGLKALIIVSSPAEIVTQFERVKLPIECDHQKCSSIIQQLHEYFDGTRQQFTIPIDWDGMNTFEERVLRATLAIPYGETRTYREIASQVSTPFAARAVGHVEASNPIPIVIPCHRVIGVDGLLRGYSGHGGIATKQWLLEHEQKHKK